MSTDVAASVRARLLNHARGQGEEFERTLARSFCGDMEARRSLDAKHPGVAVKTTLKDAGVAL